MWWLRFALLAAVLVCAGGLNRAAAAEPASEAGGTAAGKTEAEVQAETKVETKAEGEAGSGMEADADAGADDWAEEDGGGDDWGDEGEDRTIRDILDELPLELNGFLDARGGVMTQRNPWIKRDAQIGEIRFQLKAAKDLTDWARVVVKMDSVYDGVDDDTYWEMREGNLSLSLPEPVDNMDVKIGRQILTWGTGDLIFINDLFPKNWEAFFIGRDEEYLKEPSDAAKVSVFWPFVNVNFVYVPQFDPDGYIDGRRVSYWNGSLGSLAGRNAPVHAERPGDWFRDDEFHLRLYRTVGSFELSLYGYWGYWKSPGGMNPANGKAVFPRLNVYGASLLGPVFSGIGKIEAGYYDSREDESGKDPMINNSEFRFLLGFEKELAEKFTAAAQYYVEFMINHDEYRETLPATSEPRDEFRHLLTLRLTKLLMQENLRLSFFCYFSPSDHDAYFRPNVSYKFTDNLKGEVGANLFAREDRHTFFGQFGEMTNVYAAVRYSF